MSYFQIKIPTIIDHSQLDQLLSASTPLNSQMTSSNLLLEQILEELKSINLQNADKKESQAINTGDNNSSPLEGKKK